MPYTLTRRVPKMDNTRFGTLLRGPQIHPRALLFLRRTEKYALAGGPEPRFLARQVAKSSKKRVSNSSLEVYRRIGN